MKVIAEVGSNWKTLEDVLDSIDIAKQVGADTVKFQFFTDSEMYVDHPDYTKVGITPYLNAAWLKPMADLAESEGIELMCTAFSPHGYDLVNHYVNTHKIASAEITDLDILKKVNSFGKPVYLSTGGATAAQIRTALEYLEDCMVTIFYCVTAYPARVVDFRHLAQMIELFGDAFEYGYSDHSIDVMNIPMLAQLHGCDVIEKHVNFTNHTDTNDAPHSLNSYEFNLMVKTIRGQKITLEETFQECSWQRKKIKEGSILNYFRTK